MSNGSWQEHFAKLPVLGEEYGTSNAQHLSQWLISKQILMCKGREVSHLTPLNSGSETVLSECVYSRVVPYVNEDALAATAFSHHCLLKDLSSYRVMFRQPLATDAFSRTLVG